MSQHDLKQYVPDYYDGITDMTVLMEAEQSDVDEVWNNIENDVKTNQHVQSADSDKLTELEALFNIVPDLTTETLAFRRSRLLNRYGLRPPFTIPWLRQQLDNLIGAGQYELTVVPNAYTLYISCAAENQSFYQEIAATVAYSKPCNLIFVYQPQVIQTVSVTEEILLLSRIYNYHLGTSWNLGRKPFSSFRNNPPQYNYTLGNKWQIGAGPFASYNGELIKTANTPSIQSSLLSGAASFAAADVASVRINSTLVINAFQLKQSVGTQAIIEYNIMPEQTQTITLIELLDASGNVLTSSTVYIPVILGVLMTHKINFKEVTS